jgi:hypothetical protein
VVSSRSVMPGFALGRLAWVVDPFESTEDPLSRTHGKGNAVADARESWTVTGRTPDTSISCKGTIWEFLPAFEQRYCPLLVSRFESPG